MPNDIDAINSTFAEPPMEELLKLSYEEYIALLREKYGNVKYNYFANEKCATVCRKNARSNEGLYIHHICESIVPKRSSAKNALRSPFFYQWAENPVYCNDLEHLLLHIKIAELPYSKFVSADFLSSKSPEANALGGVYEFLIPKLNDIYGGYEGSRPDYIRSKILLQHRFEDYILILKYFFRIISEENPPSLISYKACLSKGYSLGEVEKVRDAVFNNND